MLEIMKARKGLIGFKKTFRSFRVIYSDKNVSSSNRIF